MNLTFAAQLNKMITAGLGGAVEAPETGVNNVWSDADEVSLTYGNIYYTEGY